MFLHSHPCFLVSLLHGNSCSYTCSLAFFISRYFTLAYAGYNDLTLTDMKLPHIKQVREIISDIYDLLSFCFCMAYCSPSMFKLWCCMLLSSTSGWRKGSSAGEVGREAKVLCSMRANGIKTYHTQGWKEKKISKLQKYVEDKYSS